MKKVAVIGAGPAGMMAALAAARGGADVRLLDTNGFPGKKLNITGKGRCNLTNDCDLDTFMRNVPRGGKFLYGAFSAFPPQELMAFFQSRGVRLTVERGRRVFPESGRARDITDALAAALGEQGVTVEKARARALCFSDGVLSGVDCGQRRVQAQSVIVATGGMSYPLTGSDGSGYALAAQAGHTIVPTEGSLIPLLSPDGFCAELTGLSLKNVTLSLVSADGRREWRDGPGELLFTHIGLSGPLVLTASAHWQKDWDARIDLKPGLTDEQLDARILRDFRERGGQTLDNALRGLLPKSLVSVILGICEIPPDTRVSAVTRDSRLRLLNALKAMPVRISGKADIAEAVITRGGVDVREVSPKTMESKLVPGLYFAGEVLDADAYTGGFNLQIAFCTGYAAGMSVNS
ncbi:MAG: NAD(P)/FAD-dependent oxidoreductase [Oscillospiraceae bacterium]|jgi:predicted Rossmann fold flavoprotein|nr:NAD(P)/FAD-dependent oxidoreductase [Oscillospiraceae bacterium]